MDNPLSNMYELEMIRLDVLTPQELCSLYHILLNHCVVQQCVQGAQKVFKERSKVKSVSF